jgi:hypothetical protein
MAKVQRPQWRLERFNVEIMEQEVWICIFGSLARTNSASLVCPNASCRRDWVNCVYRLFTQVISSFSPTPNPRPKSALPARNRSVSLKST